VYRMSELCVFSCGGIIVKCFCVCRIAELCVFLRVGCQKFVVLSRVGCQSFDGAAFVE